MVRAEVRDGPTDGRASPDGCEGSLDRSAYWHRNADAGDTHCDNHVFRRVCDAKKAVAKTEDGVQPHEASGICASEERRVAPADTSCQTPNCAEKELKPVL